MLYRMVSVVGLLRCKPLMQGHDKGRVLPPPGSFTSLKVRPNNMRNKFTIAARLTEPGRGEARPLTVRDARGRCGEHTGGQP
jgi:hypothetical protein